MGRWFTIAVGLTLGALFAALVFLPSGPQYLPFSSAVVVGTNNGSGLLVDPDHVLTAGHVVHAFGPGTLITTQGGSRALAQSVVVGGDWSPEKRDVPDIGIYFLNRSLLVMRARVDCSPLRVGQTLYAVSSQYFIGDRFLTKMMVSALDEDDKRLGRGMVLVQSNFWPGMSGSPVFNERGELVGVVDDMIGMPIVPIPGAPTIGYGYGGIAGPSIVCAALRKIHFFGDSK